MRQYSWLLGIFGGFAVATFLVYAAFADQVETPWAIAGGVGAALIATWLWLDREGIGRSMSTRGAKYTGASAAMVALALGIAAAGNVLGYRYDERWDVTASRQHTLSEQTLKVVAALDRDVTVLAFFSHGSSEETGFRDLVAGYEEASERLKVEFHDPIREPMVAREHNITSAYGTLLLTSGDDKQRIESDFGEESLTNAIIRLTSGRQHVLCFTTGHEELDPDDDQGGSGLGAAVMKLEDQNYTVKKVLLAREGRVPSDCEVLVVPDPQSDWLPIEREMAAAWVAGGGKMLVLIDPTHAPGLAADMARFGIKVGDDIVLEQNPNYQLVGGDASYLILDASGFDHHTITSAIKGAVMMRVARTVSAGPAVAGIQVQELVRTSDYSWAETTLDGKTVPFPDPGTDAIGKVSVLAVADVTDPSAIAVGATTLPVAEGPLPGVLPAPEGGAVPPSMDAVPGAAEPAPAAAPATNPERKAGGKVVVVGDSDFASNEMLGQFSNLDLFSNAVAWLAGEEDQVSIRPNAAGSGTLAMNVIQGILVWLTALLFVPGATVVAALATWRKRRNL